MIRRVRVGFVTLGIAILMVSPPFLKLSNCTFGQEQSQEVKAALKERDRLWDQTQKLRAAGKIAEAIAAAEAMLATERNVLPADHADLTDSMEWLAGMHLEREEFAAAKTARVEALKILRKRYGEKHWKATDARLALEDVDRRIGMTQEQRQRVAEADRLNGEVMALIGAGKSGDALQPARRALAIREEALGERHPFCATSLNNLAFLLYSQKDYAPARPLYEKALTIYKEVLGERHPVYAGCLKNLAALLQSQGDYATAKPLCEKALAIRKEVLGERRPTLSKAWRI